MSSFVVKDSTMQNIVNGLFWNHDLYDRIKYQLDSKGYRCAECFTKLGQDLFDMNYQATNIVRYNTPEEIKPVFKWKSTGIVNPIQLLKSLQCLKYQCSEGRVVETDLYLMLKNIEHTLMMLIIEQNTDYNSRSWD